MFPFIPGATWGTQVEATSFYARQTAVEDLSIAFLVFGLALLLYTIIANPNKRVHSKRDKEVN